jgi:hypothetical protein
MNLRTYQGNYQQQRGRTKGGAPSRSSHDPWRSTLPPPLYNSCLLPIAKSAGGICPIAISKVWYKLAALCALAVCPDAGRSLSLLQVGVGIEWGSQVAGHALRAGIATDPGCITKQID